MAIHVQILAAKLSQHYFLDAISVTALLLLMTAGYLVPKDSQLDQWTGLAHNQQPLLLCLGVCFLAEGLLCWKLVGAMKQREGTILPWLLANGLSTSACLACMSTSMAKFIFIHQYAESCWTAGLLFVSYAAAKVSKLVLVFRFSRALERGYEEFEPDSDGSQSPEQPLKRTLRLKRLLCILWSAMIVLFPAIVLIFLYFMSTNVQEETDRRLAKEVEKEVCQMSTRMMIAGGLVWFLGFAINTLILVLVAGALAVATDGPAALPVALVWIICVAENLGRITRYTKCCLEMWEMFRKTTFAFAILPPRVRFGCD